jgi:hypothetical protein
MKITKGRIWTVCFVALCGGNIGCNTAKRDYAAAEQANTEQAYRQFLIKHPTNEMAVAASRHLENLAWRNAQNSDTGTAYQDYLKIFPKGLHATDAEEHLRVVIRLPFKFEACCNFVVNQPMETHVPNGYIGTYDREFTKPVTVNGSLKWVAINGRRFPLIKAELLNGIFETRDFGKLKMTIAGISGIAEGTPSFVMQLYGTRAQKESIQAALDSNPESFSAGLTKSSSETVQITTVHTVDPQIQAARAAAYADKAELSRALESAAAKEKVKPEQPSK